MCKACYHKWWGANRPACSRHPDRAARTRGMCRSCYEQWLLDTHPERKAHSVAKRAAWAKSNPDRVRAAHKRWISKPENVANLAIRRRFRYFGITQQGFEELSSK